LQCASSPAAVGDLEGALEWEEEEEERQEESGGAAGAAVGDGGREQ